ncbi:hypothetical protein Tco_0549345 [Tanacetum coccineum]
MKVFPLSLADDAKEWWIGEEITTWEELVEKFFCRFYPESYDGEDEMTQKVIFHAWINGNWNKRYVDNSISSSNELKESEYENQSNTATDSFFKAYELPNKRRCKAEKFEAIQYSLGPNEEYIAIRSYEYDIWERSEDNTSKIYQDIIHKKDEGWKDIKKEISTKLVECIFFWNSMCVLFVLGFRRFSAHNLAQKRNMENLPSKY